MLFDVAPKGSRADLFDRERELSEVKSLGSPVTLVLGLRRTGKSSVIRVAVNELEAERGIPHIYVDLRRFEESPYMAYRDLLQELQREVNRLTSRFPSLLELLRAVQGISIMGNEVRLSWVGRGRASLGSLLEALDDWAGSEGRVVVVVLDEAQELAKLRGINLLPVLAYAYDNLHNVRFIVSGSEVGLLYDFLRLEDPGAPLYGRYVDRVELGPFTREQAVQFLRRGFEELGARLSDESYEGVYEALGGIPGWLTYFGYSYYRTRDLEGSVSSTLEAARGMILREFENFLATRSVARRRYYVVMRAVARCGSWSDVKRALEADVGAPVSDSEVYNYLGQLVKHSWVVKRDDRYCPAEPLIGRAFLS